jgi:hypothetical protein
MTKVKKAVSRESGGTVYERGKHRNVIVILEPPDVIGFRLKGMRHVFRLTTEGCYMAAVKAEIALKKKEKLKEKKKKRRK